LQYPIDQLSSPQDEGFHRLLLTLIVANAA